MPRMIWIWMTIFLIACGDGGKITHPDSAQFPSSDRVAHRVDISRPSGDFPSHLFTQLTTPPSAVFGGGEAFSMEYTIDYVPPKLGVDRFGLIYVVQEHGNTVNVYDRSGTFAYAIGKGGHGPGEFVRLRSFAFDRDHQTLYVLDLTKIEVFKRTAGRFEYVSTILLDMLMADDICEIDSVLFVTGHRIAREAVEAVKSGEKWPAQARVARPILRIDLADVENPTSFGYVYESRYGWGYYDYLMSESNLICNRQTRTVVGIPRHFPFLIGYDIDGNEQWVSRIDGYIGTQFTEEMTPKGPAFYGNTNPETFHRKLPVAEADLGEYLVMQFIERLPQIWFASSPDITLSFTGVHTVLVHAGTGRLSYSDAVAPVVGIRPDMAVTYHFKPLHPTRFEIHGRSVL